MTVHSSVARRQPNVQQSSVVPARGIRATQQLLAALFGPPEERAFAVRLWNGLVESPPSITPAFTLVLRRPGTLRRMLFPPSEMSLVEAYISGDADIEGSMEAATALGDAVVRQIGSLGGYIRLLPSIVALPTDEPESRGEIHRANHLWRYGREHTTTRDAQAVRFHYDVGNDFYALWLDQRMVYSCGYFEPGVDDLDTAQRAKLDLICRKLRLAPGERFLDIGCGWGGLIRHAAEHFGVQAVGITLSEPQANEARARIAADGLANRCSVEVRDYRTLTDCDTFDKIASVGMVEHVGEQRLPDYFAAAYRALKPGGLFLNHGIISLADARPQSLSDRISSKLWRRGAFIDHYVFPDGNLAPFAKIVETAEARGFETRDVESLREHYAKTLRHWVARLEARAAEAVAQVGEPTYRTWRLYMAASARAFTTASIGIVQTLFAKADASGRSHIPPTRQDIYQTTITPPPTAPAPTIS